MKHKLKITILSILFGLLFGIPVYADSNTYIIDQSDVLGEYISTLNEKAETISEEAGLRITCMITNTTEGMELRRYLSRCTRDCLPMIRALC